jgi:hypothetical protein
MYEGAANGSGTNSSPFGRLKSSAFVLLVAGFSFFATERVDQEDKIKGMRRYGSDLQNTVFCANEAEFRLNRRAESCASVLSQTFESLVRW